MSTYSDMYLYTIFVLFFCFIYIDIYYGMHFDIYIYILYIWIHMLYVCICYIYLLLTHVRNKVSVRDLIADAVSTFHCTRVKLFVGTSAEAKEAALRDADQHYIESFLAYKGNSEVRSTIIFYIKFA
jgi:hypothetical protein